MEEGGSEWRRKSEWRKGGVSGGGGSEWRRGE